MALGPRSRRDLGLIALVLGAAALLYPRALFRGESFYARDLHLDWYPRLVAIARSLRQGSWPLWDPSIGFGQPLLADPGTQTAYPLAWPSLLVPLGAAYTVLVLLHLAIAALGSDRLARRLGAGPLGSAAAALLFVLSGPLQSALNLWHHFATACWMPWVIAAAERAWRRADARSTAWLGLVAGLQLLAGSADVCAMTWALVAAWCALRLARERRRGRSLAALAAGGALAAGMALVVWLPAADLLSRSPRRDLRPDVRGTWAVPPAGLLRVVAPLDRERVPFDAATWRRLYDRAEGPLLDSLDVGVATLAVALLPLGSRRLRRRGALLLGGAAATLVFAMGPHGPLYGPLAAAVPLLRVFRYPSKAMLPFALAVALAAGLGVGLVARRRLGSGWLRAAGALAALGGAVAAFAAGRFQPLPTLPLLGAAAGAVLALASLPRVEGRAAALLLATVCAAELATAHASLNATAPLAALLAPPDAVGQVDRREGRRLYVYEYRRIEGTSERLLGRPDAYRTAAPPPGVDARAFATAAVRRYLPPPSAGLYGLEGSYDLDIRGLFPRDLNDLTHRLRFVEGSPEFVRMLRMGAVGTVLSLHRKGLDGLRLVGALPSLFPEPILVWRVPGTLPRAHLVGCARVADRGDAFRALSDPAFDPERETILPAPVGVDGECGQSGSARVTAFLADRVRVACDASREGLLVLADAWDPAWRASVDGAPVPVLRADIGFRAVRVPPGRHEVEMVYRPRPALWGAALSVVSLLSVALLSVAGRRTRERRRRREGGRVARETRLAP